jgi:hypothetical protein
MKLFFLLKDFYFKLFLHCSPKRTYFFVLCFIKKTQPFVKRKPVKTGEKKITGTIAFRFRQVLLYSLQKFSLGKEFYNHPLWALCVSCSLNLNDVTEGLV